MYVYRYLLRYIVDMSDAKYGLLPSSQTRNRTPSEGDSSDSSSRRSYRLEEDTDRVIILTQVTSISREEDEDSGISETSLLDVDINRTVGADRKEEKIMDVFVQVFIPFMIAGFGMMAAGLLLDAVQVCMFCGML